VIRELHYSQPDWNVIYMQRVYTFSSKLTPFFTYQVREIH